MHQGCVLIVADEPILAYGLKAQFEQWGFERVEWIDTSHDTLLSIEGQSIALAVVGLNDEAPPLQKALQVLEHCPLPIVFLSTFAARSDRRRLKPFQHYKRLSKPCHIPELRRAVENLLTIKLPKE